MLRRASVRLLSSLIVWACVTPAVAQIADLERVRPVVPPAKAFKSAAGAELIAHLAAAAEKAADPACTRDRKLDRQAFLVLSSYLLQDFWQQYVDQHVISNPAAVLAEFEKATSAIAGSVLGPDPAKRLVDVSAEPEVLSHLKRNTDATTDIFAVAAYHGVVKAIERSLKTNAAVFTEAARADGAVERHDTAARKVQSDAARAARPVVQEFLLLSVLYQSARTKGWDAAKVRVAQDGLIETVLVPKLTEHCLR